MKIQQLFDELKIITEDTETVFADSGIVNWSEKMKYGFFPLGLGVLTDNITMDSKASEVEILEHGVMVLGNDFGTITYAEKYFGKIGETDSITIKNLKNINVDLDLRKTFFTNYYLGIRDDKKYPEATMRKRAVALSQKYKQLCHEFFIIQLNLINPDIIICLGHDVKNALANVEDSFLKWKSKSTSLARIYEEGNHIIKNKVFGNREFVVIPHPCDLRNFTEIHMGKLNEFLNNRNE